MVSNGTTHKIGAALAHPAGSAGKSTVDARLPRNSQDAVVFIIDDDVAVREALHSLLRDVRLQAEVFGSPTEFLASKMPDAASCLVLDIRLPGVGGLDFQAELARANIDIPIIFMTGYADIPMAARAMKAGAVDFLTKPFREQDMLDAVAIGIERDRIRREGDKAASGMHALFETLSPSSRARSDGSGDVRIDEQASGSKNRARGIHGEDASRTSHEEDGSEVPRRSHQDGRNSLVSSRAGQAIEDTRTARAGQSRQSISRQFPAAACIPRGGRSHAGPVHG
jgi:FixJ family two-component response regulator